jgi:hypothetical protein
VSATGQGCGDCPVEPAVRQWLEARAEWIRGEFGSDRIRFAEVILPTEDYFSDAYAGTERDARTILDKVCSYMDVDPAAVDLHFYDSHPLEKTLGLYEAVEGKYRIWIEYGALADPLSLVATMAHELAHVHLLGHGRVTADVEDHEPLTDLLTVFFGLGVIMANAVIRESYWNAGAVSGWNMTRQGYLTIPMYAYALALFTQARGEARPAWAKHLRPDVRAEFTKACRFLAQEPSRARATSVPPFPRAAPPREQTQPEIEPEEEESPFPWNAEEVLQRYAAGVRDFHDADLRGIDLRGANLSSADLSEAELSEADLTDANLTECNLSGAELRRATLRGAVLKKSNLRGADFSLADLTNAKFDCADLCGNNLSGAVLRWARVLEVAFDSSTQFTGVDFSEVVFDAALRKEVERRAARKERFAGDWHGPWRWLVVGVAVIATTCGGMLGGGMLGACLQAVVGHAFEKEALVVLSGTVGGAWLAWIGVRKLVWPKRR